MSDNDFVLADEAAAWFARLKRGDLSGEDLREFETWKCRTPAHEQAWSEVCRLWNDPAMVSAAHIAAGSVLPSRDVIRLFLPRRGLMAGAVIGLLAGLAWVILVGPDFLVQFQADDWTAVGEQRSLQLPDGSTATLNTRTAIATEFHGPSRHVTLLAGEAFFAVRPDPEKPFLVESRNVVARAMGTAFLVKKQDDGLQVAVMQGRVNISLRGDAAAHVELTAGQQVAISGDRLPVPVPANPELLTAWLRGRLVFDSAPLAQVVDELNRYHAGRIVVLGADIRRIHVTGTYHLSDTSAILDTLAQTLPIHKIQLTHRLVLLY